jgi:hypothetical protein
VQHDSQLVLSSHGKRLRIGAFLSPDERAQVAHALAKLRSPEYLQQAHDAAYPEEAAEAS